MGCLMFIGHYAPALLLKTSAPRLPLWSLFVAVEVLDYLWSAFVLLGIEHMRITPGFTQSNAFDLYDMPYTHSLVATIGWSLLAFGLTVLWQRREPGRLWSGFVIALAVASHFLLDLPVPVHVRDLPLAGPDSHKLGFGLWSNRTGALLLETSLFVGSALALSFSTKWRARRSWWVLAAVMTAICVVNYFLPGPKTPTELALSGLAFYVLFPILAWRVEFTSGAGSSPSPG